MDFRDRGRESLDGLVAEWNNPQLKETLKQRLRIHIKQPFQTTEQILSQEFYRSWLDVPMSNPLQRLIRHPLLDRKDRESIDGYVAEQQSSQIKYSLGFTAATLTLYSLALRRKAFFVRLFNKKDRHWFWNGSRKFLACYSIFLAWMQVLSYHYEKKIPRGLQEKGIFKKYRILFE